MRGLHKAISAAVAAAALASAGSAGAATVLNVGWGDGCGATNCFSQGAYSHTWSAANAAGPITVSQLDLARTILGDLDGQTFRLSFQLNGQELGSWGSFTMGGIGGDQLSFAGENFTWNPEDGDLTLVLEIYVPKMGVGGGGGFAFNAQPGPGPGEGGDGGLIPQDNGGDNQQPADTGPGPSAVVPEPTTWALMIGGFGMAGAIFRRRRAVLGMQLTR